MTNGWNATKEMAERHGEGGGKFVKLPKDGDKIVGVFCGEPFPKEVYWTGEKYLPYNGEPGIKPIMRVAMNFFDLQTRAMRIMENGVTWYKDLLKVKDKYGLEHQAYEVERHGSGAQTSYTIMPERKLTDEEAREIAGTALHDLSQSGGGDEKSDFNSYGKSKDAALDPHEASEMVAKLKSLPREDVDSFLKRFSVQKVRDLKAADKDAAWGFIREAEARRDRGKAQPEGEIDPFA